MQYLKLSVFLSSLLLIGCSGQPSLYKINNNIATSQLFLIGEMSGQGYHYLGTKNNMMVFQSRKNKQIASFSVSGDNKSSSIQYLGKKSDNNIDSVLKRVKSYSEQWKDKNDKQVTFSQNDKFSSEDNSKFSQTENTELLPALGNTNDDPMPFDPSRDRYKGAEDPALKNRL